MNRAGIGLLLAIALGVLTWTLAGGRALDDAHVDSVEPELGAPRATPPTPAADPATGAESTTDPGDAPPAPLQPIWKVERATAAGATDTRLVVQLLDEQQQPLALAGVTLQVARFARQGDRTATAALGACVTDADGRADLTTIAPDLADSSAGTPTAHLAIAPADPRLYVPLGKTDDTVQRIALAPLIAALRGGASGDRVLVPVQVWRARKIVFRVVDHEGLPLRDTHVNALPAFRFTEPHDLISDDQGLVTVYYLGRRTDPDLGAKGWTVDQGLDRFEISRRDLRGQLTVADAFAHAPDLVAVGAIVGIAQTHGVSSPGRRRLRLVLEQEGLADPHPRLQVEPSRRIDLECLDSEQRPIADTDLTFESDDASVALPNAFRTDGFGKAWVLVPGRTRMLTVKVVADGFLEAKVPLPANPTPVQATLLRLVEARVDVTLDEALERVRVHQLRWVLELADRDVPIERRDLRIDGESVRLRIPATDAVLRATTPNGKAGGTVKLQGIAGEHVTIQIGTQRETHEVAFLLRDAGGALRATRVLVRAVGETRKQQFQRTVRTDARGRLTVQMADGTWPHVLFFWSTGGDTPEPRMAELTNVKLRNGGTFVVRYQPPKSRSR